MDSILNFLGCLESLSAQLQWPDLRWPVRGDCQPGSMSGMYMHRHSLEATPISGSGPDTPLARSGNRQC